MRSDLIVYSIFGTDKQIQPSQLRIKNLMRTVGAIPVTIALIIIALIWFGLIERGRE
jgi:ABC-type sugar transport system permease subunit